MDVRDTQPVSAVILSQRRVHREGKILNGLELSIGGTKLPPEFRRITAQSLLFAHVKRFTLRVDAIAETMEMIGLNDHERSRPSGAPSLSET